MFGVFSIIFDILFFILKAVAFCAAPFFVSAAVWFVYYRFIKRMKLPPIHKAKKPVRENLLIKLFVFFPRRLVLDMFNRVPGSFALYGLHLFCGEQGSGKTITICYMLEKIKRDYPKVKIRTNFNYEPQDGEINNWVEVVDNNNGIFGQVEALDELQNWFSSMESKNFPPEMLTEITQQRKQRKCILGTSQVFTRVSKPIREQVTLLYEPKTIAGCFTVCFVFKPNCGDDGTIIKKRFVRMFCFVHSDELRNCYDTYLKIERYKASGFKERTITSEL